MTRGKISLIRSRDWPVDRYANLTNKAYDEATLSNARLHLAIAGCLGWLEFAVTHAAQDWNLLPWMGWGLVYYLDLFCTIGGTLLLLAALVVKPRSLGPHRLRQRKLTRQKSR
jgi:hypothetical protein